MREEKTGIKSTLERAGQSSQVGGFFEKRRSRLFASSFEGRDDKTRTCDLAPPRRVRYQLRYIPFLTFVGAKIRQIIKIKN